MPSVVPCTTAAVAPPVRSASSSTARACRSGTKGTIKAESARAAGVESTAATRICEKESGTAGAMIAP